MAWSNKIVRVTSMTAAGILWSRISNQDGKGFILADYLLRAGWTFEIIDNFTYHGVLRLKNLCCGRHGIAHGYFMMSDEYQVQMSASDLADEIPKMERGVLQGSFTWKKTGSAVNLYRVPETLEQ